MKNMAENLIKLKVNKKLLQQKLSIESGKIVTLKDISNLVTRMNAAEKRNDLQNTINNLQNQYGKFQESYFCKLFSVKKLFQETFNSTNHTSKTLKIFLRRYD